MPSNQKYYHKKKPKPEDHYEPPYPAELLSEPVEGLSVSPAVLNKLKAGKVDTLSDVAKRRGKDFYKISTFNKKDLFELKKAVNLKKIDFRPDEVPAEDGVQQADVLPQGSNNNNRQNPQNTPPQQQRNAGRGQENRNPDLSRQDRGQRPPQENRSQPQGIPNRQPGGNMPKNQKQANHSMQNRQEGFLQGKQPNQKNPDKKGFDLSISEKKTREEREKLRPSRPQVVLPQDMYIKLNKNGKWGFADRSGKEVVHPVYDEVFAYREEVCCVEKDELFGFIDRKGEEVIPIIYECAASFSEGYACVFKNGHCGYIDKSNAVIIDFRFDAGTAVIDGNCRVKRDGKWGELHLDNPGEIRWIN